MIDVHSKMKTKLSSLHCLDDLMDTLARKIELVSDLLQRDALIAEFEDLSITSWVSSWARRERPPLPPRESRKDRYSAFGQTAPAVPLARVPHPCT